MKEFDTQMVTISPEEYDQLQKCKSLVECLWKQFGPHNWPQEFHLPKGKTFADLDDEDEFDFYQIRSRFERLFEYDDNE